jgi:hypothetical protein
MSEEANPFMMPPALQAVYAAACARLEVLAPLKEIMGGVDDGEVLPNATDNRKRGTNYRNKGTDNLEECSDSHIKGTDNRKRGTIYRNKGTDNREECTDSRITGRSLKGINAGEVLSTTLLDVRPRTRMPLTHPTFSLSPISHASPP